MTDDKQPGAPGGQPKGPPPGGQSPGSPPSGGQPQGSPAAAKPLTPEEQMALYEEDLKENDWGHQPC